MLVIEGPDMVGKTEFVTALMIRAKGLGIELERDKFGMAESAPGAMMPALASRVRPGVVADRCWLSEIVYGVSCQGRGRPPSISPADHAEAQRLMGAAGGMLVVIAATPGAYSRLAATHHGRGEAYSVKDCESANHTYSYVGCSGRLPHWLPSEHAQWRGVAVSVDKTHILSACCAENQSYPGLNSHLVEEVLYRYMERQQFRATRRPS